MQRRRERKAAPAPPRPRRPPPDLPRSQNAHGGGTHRRGALVRRGSLPREHFCERGRSEEAGARGGTAIPPLGLCAAADYTPRMRFHPLIVLVALPLAACTSSRADRAIRHAAPPCRPCRHRSSPISAPINIPSPARRRRRSTSIRDCAWSTASTTTRRCARSTKRRGSIPTARWPHWGVALALGPNINLPLDAERATAAHAALQRADALAPKASPAEQAYIAALAKRYSDDPNADRKALDRAYADAMRQVAQRTPGRSLTRRRCLPSR